MKPYKIAVPESKIYEKEKGYPALITCQEIHELINPHAQKLGWNEYPDVLMDKQFIFFYPNGSVGWTAHRDYYDAHKFQEISWNEFLKLTPEDVNDGTPINLVQNTVENIQAISTTDRNEKAWEIYKILINNHQLDAEIYKLEKAYNTQIGTEFYSKLAFVMADEFIKQAGNK